MESGSRYCWESFYTRAQGRFRRCYSSVAIATVDVWLLPWRQVDPFLRGSLADLEDHLCQTFPAAQGLPVHKNKQYLFARITNQFTAIRYSCSGFGLGVQSFLFYAKIRTWAKLLSIYLSRADFDVKNRHVSGVNPLKELLRKHSWEIATCFFFFSFLHKFFNRLPWSDSIWNSPHSNASFYVHAW